MKEKVEMLRGAGVPKASIDEHASFEFSLFSDNFAVSAPSRYAEKLLTLLAFAIHSLLNAGLLVRGGVALGPLHHRGNVLFGPALIQAVELEKRARYPRLLCALEDAQLLMTEIVGARADEIAPLREHIPLTAPEPVAVEAWVASALQGNLEVRSAELQLEALAREIAVQRGKGLPTLSLSAAGTRLRQDQNIGGNQTFDTVGIWVSWPCFKGARSPPGCVKRAHYTARRQPSTRQHSVIQNARPAAPTAA